MPDYPLLDMESAWRETLSNLRDMIGHVENVHQECEGQYPPEAEQGLATLAQIQTLLENAIPPALREAIDKEQQQYEEDESYWSRD